MNSSSQINITALLPRSGNSQLCSKKEKLQVLHFTLKLVEILNKSISSFLEKDYAQFDAQVGENLCQIRAYKIYLMGLELFCSDRRDWYEEQQYFFESYAHTIKKRIQIFMSKITQQGHYDKELDGKESLTAFFTRMNLQANLPVEIFFLLQCYFLSYFSLRNDNIPFSVDRAKIAKTLKISNYHAKRLTVYYQTEVCKVCSSFVKELAQNIFSTDYYEQVLPRLILEADERRLVYPCFEITRILLTHMVKNAVPIVVVIDRKIGNKVIDKLAFFYKGHVNKRSFQPISIDGIKSKGAIIILAEAVYPNLLEYESRSSYVEKFMCQTPENLLLYNTAAHPQYPGDKLEAFNLNPYKLIDDIKDQEYLEKTWLESKQIAIKKGCSLENPTFFFLKHVFCHGQVNKWLNFNKYEVIQPYERKRYFAPLNESNQLSIA